MPNALDTAIEHATRNVPTAPADSSAADARGALAGHVYDTVADVAVLDGERLVGLVAIETLLAAPAQTPLRALMEADPPIVGPGTDQEHAALHMVRSGQSSLAVVDAQGRFLGLIPPDRMLAVLVEEHEEDLARLGGYLAGTERARSASEERVWQRLVHRVPWLLLGLAGAMLAAGIVGSYEEQLRQVVLLAFFVPGVVYMADAVGTQTEAVVIRGIAVGVPARRIVLREVMTGLAIGLVIGAAFFPLGWAIWSDVSVALGVALALWASCAIATVVAMALPYLLDARGLDPAFGAGPLATVIQDLLSIVIYFAITVPIAI